MLKEMQMLTGVLTNDYDYLLALLLKKSSAAAAALDKIKFEEPKPIAIRETVGLDEWFSTMEEL